MHVYSLVVVPEFQPDQLIAISKCLFLFHMNMIIIVLEFILRGSLPPRQKAWPHTHVNCLSNNLYGGMLITSKLIARRYTVES